jgi:hypothetical protein
MEKYGISRNTVLAGLAAFFILLAFILVNYYRSYQEQHQTPDPFAREARETVPESLEGTAKRLVFHDFEWGNINDTASHLALTGHSGKQSYKMSSTVPYSPGLWIKFKELKPGDSSWIRATAYVWFSSRPGDIKCNLIATCNHKGVNFKYVFIELETENLKPDQWNRVSIDYRIPRAPDPEDVLQAYFWYRGRGEMFVDDIEVKYFTR